jgi:hypothetical protein
MSRLFNGTTDVHTYNLPASGTGPVNYAFGTLMIVARFLTASGWASLIELERSTGNEARGGLGRHGTTGGLYTNDFTATHDSTEAGGTSFTVGSGDNWCLYAATRATGTASPTLYKIPIATGTRTTNQLTATLVDVSNIASGFIRVGGNDDFVNMRVAAVAVLPGVVLSGAQLDAIVAAKTTASIIAVAGADGWVVDDSDGLTNNLVAGNTNLSAGTSSTDADNPAGWVYAGAAATAGPAPRSFNAIPFIGGGL